MKPHLLKIQNDFVRADFITAVTVNPYDPDSTETPEADDAVFLCVYLSEHSEPLRWYYEKRAAAELVQAQTVGAWLDAINDV